MKTYSVEQAKKDHPNWFSPEANRFFGTRVCYSTEIRGEDSVLFVTSERRPHSSDPRLYTIREATPEGIETIGSFQAYRSRAEAIRALNSVLGRG